MGGTKQLLMTLDEFAGGRAAATARFPSLFR
jgi:hypothetical protein